MELNALTQQMSCDAVIQKYETTSSFSSQYFKKCKLYVNVRLTHLPCF